MAGFIDEVRSAFTRVATAEGIQPEVAQLVAAETSTWAQRDIVTVGSTPRPEQ